MKKLLPIFIAFIYTLSYAQEFVPNYDESKIPDYTLPELLISKNGQKVKSAEQWENFRRAEILNEFRNQVYGQIPSGDFEVEIKIIKEIDVFDGKAIMKEVRMTYKKNNKSISMDMLIFLPKSTSPLPMFLGLNFYGNHTILNHPEISLASSWVRNNEDFHITENKATEASRGVRESRWPVEMIIGRGYGLATIYYGDIDPDKDDFTDGIHALFYENGQTKPAEDEWGSIAGWAWGLSRAMDYFEQDEDIDASKIALMGHSRLGKASLCAGAYDQRFAIVISNDSGCGGAALSRRRIGETVGRINTAFPHWFCDNFNAYSNNEDALPIDQHQLVGLIAPRPVYVNSAQNDHWADPKGEFLSAYLAGEVYKLYGLKGLPKSKLPKVNQPVQETVGYHIRTGGHDVTDFDWQAWMDFADIHFNR